MASVPSSYKGIIKEFEKSPEHIQNYYKDLPNLVKDFDNYQIAIAYLFMGIEKAQHQALYCGIVKLHKGNARLTSTILQAQHITRESYRAFFEGIFKKPIPVKILTNLQTAEKIRDRAIHGKAVTAPEARSAIHHALQYAISFDAFVNELGKFSPFGDLRGFIGAAKTLPTSTTRWILKGMGFTVVK